MEIFDVARNREQMIEFLSDNNLWLTSLAAIATIAGLYQKLGAGHSSLMVCGPPRGKVRIMPVNFRNVLSGWLKSLHNGSTRSSRRSFTPETAFIG